MIFERGRGSVRRWAASYRLSPPPPLPPAAYTWYDNPEVVAQLSHFGWGAFVVLCLSLHVNPLWPICVGAACAAIKEFVVDSWLPIAWWGEGDSWGSSAVDFLFYLLGGGGGFLAWLWR